MREVVLRLPRIAVEDVLDRLPPLVPSGVREGRSGAHAELLMRGPDIPPDDVIAAAVGRWPHTLTEREISDDWRLRRLADYEPDLIGGRLVVRPEWAYAPPDAQLRAMLILAEGLFRLDVTASGDTLRTIVRNYTSDELTMSGGVYGPEGANIVLGEAAAYEPARAAVEFVIGSVAVEAIIGTLRFADRGTVRVSAQAIIRDTAGQ